MSNFPEVDFDARHDRKSPNFMPPPPAILQVIRLIEMIIDRRGNSGGITVLQ